MKLQSLRARGKRQPGELVETITKLQSLRARGKRFYSFTSVAYECFNPCAHGENGLGCISDNGISNFNPCAHGENPNIWGLQKQVVHYILWFNKSECANDLCVIMLMLSIITTNNTCTIIPSLPDAVKHKPFFPCALCVFFAWLLLPLLFREVYVPPPGLLVVKYLFSSVLQVVCVPTAP